MGRGKLCPAGIVTGESGWLPPIVDTECISEGLFVERESMLLDWKGCQPSRCSFNFQRPVLMISEGRLQVFASERLIPLLFLPVMFPDLLS